MEKHLEFIQGIITRHNSNSFMLKGWTVTISAALYALSGTVKLPYISLIAIAPIVLFWGLDALYLSNERCFVDLYNSVIKNKYSIPQKAIFKNQKDDSKIQFDEYSISPFEMDFKKFKIWKNNRWFWVLWSKTIFCFYFSMLLFSFVITFALHVNLIKEEGAIKVDANNKTNAIEVLKKSDSETIFNNNHPIDSCKANLK